MEVKQIKKVMQKYKKAWEEQNTQTVLDCFTKDGTYQESPLAKPYRGHSQIKKFWNEIVVKSTKNIKFTLGKCYVSSDKKFGFAEWECTNEQRVKYDNKFKRKKTDKWEKCRMVGIMIIEMKGEKINRLNEYWKTKLL